MAKPNYEFAKRQRDLLKKQKKEEKRKRKADAAGEAGEAGNATTADSQPQPAADDKTAA